MRLLLEIVIIGALVYLGWEIPFKQRIDEITGKQMTTVPSSSAVAPALPVAETPAPVRQLRPIVRVTPTPSGAWMWDPSHKSPLDPRSHNQPTPH